MPVYGDSIAGVAFFNLFIIFTFRTLIVTGHPPAGGAPHGVGISKIKLSSGSKLDTN
jgi:hypothetical protein